MSRTKLGIFILCIAAGFVLWAAFTRAQSVTPNITNVKIAAVGATSTTVTWTTDVPTDSRVEVSTDVSYCTVRNAGESKQDHTMVIPNLDPATTYFFRVAAEDSAGNQSFSGDYTFTTTGTINIANSQNIPQSQLQLTEKAVSLISQITNGQALEAVQNAVQAQGNANVQPPRILGKPDVEPGPDYATFKWNTDKDSDSIILLAPEGEYNPNSDNPYTRKEGDAGALATEHTVTVYGLQPSTTYHFEASSKSSLGLAGTSGDYTFQTKSFLPEISNIRVQKVEEHDATVSWSTPLPSSGEIDYTNMSTRKALTVGDPAFLVTHTLQLTNLAFQTRYSVVIRAKNQAGDEIASQPIYFLTVKDVTPPVISQVSNESTLYPSEDTKVQTIVSWQTDEPSQCYLSFVAGVVKTDKDTVKLDPETGYLLRHVRVVTEFQPATVYKYWVTCADADGNATSSEDFVLLTPQKEKSIFDIIIGNFQSTFGWLNGIGGAKK